MSAGQGKGSSAAPPSASTAAQHSDVHQLAAAVVLLEGDQGVLLMQKEMLVCAALVKCSLLVAFLYRNWSKSKKWLLKLFEKVVSDAERTNPLETTSKVNIRGSEIRGLCGIF